LFDPNGFEGLLAPKAANEPPTETMAGATPAGVDIGETLAVLAVVRQRPGGKVTGATHRNVADHGRAGARLEVVRLERIDMTTDLESLARDFRVAVSANDTLRRPTGRHSVFVAAQGPRALPDAGRARWTQTYRAIKAAIDWAVGEASWQPAQFGIVLVGKFVSETREPAGYGAFTQLELHGLVKLDAYRLERPQPQAAPAAVIPTPARAATATRRTRRAIGPVDEE
jgi:hypothetical protein